MAKLTDLATNKIIETSLQHFNNPYSFLALSDDGQQLWFVTANTTKWNDFISGSDANGVFGFELNAIDCFVRIHKITAHTDDEGRSWLELELVKVDNLEVIRTLGGME